MKRSAFLLAAALLAAGPSFTFADETDIAKGVVDPYDAGTERTRFLTAAGVDSELDEKEFTASAAASEPFARKFDSWTTLKAFDRNGNGTIDWFEADGYRKALRDAVMLTYDKDKDGKLAGEERELASKDLTAGKAPRVSLPRRERPVGPGGEAPAQPGEGRGDRGGDRGGRTDEQRAEELKKFDKDGDGSLNDEERGAARAARIEEWRKANPEEAARWDERRAEETKRREEFAKKYDKDGNGELSDEERREGFRVEGEARIAAWREANPEAAARFDKAREEFTKKHDKDGDGKLSEEERNAGFAAMREEGRKKWDELSKKYDENGDGELSREERAKLFEAERENLQGLFPGGRGPGGPGGPGGRGQRGGGQGGQGGTPRPAGDL